MPAFDEAVEGALAILRRRGRVSADALGRQFELDADALTALRRELVEVLRVAVEAPGAVLVWQDRRVPEREDGPELAEAERRQVTVLMCDLVESTPLSYRFDPEELRGLLQIYQQVCGRAIAQEQGHVATWQGDGVVALFGYPRTQEDDAVRAVRAGWGILRALEAADDEVERRYGVRLQARVGIQTGMTVVGDEGTTSSWQTHAFGPTPNVAARIQALSPPSTVTVGDETHRLAHAFFDFEDVGEQALRGVDGPVRLHRLTGLREERGPFQAALGRGLVPFVGRAHERWRLGDGCERVLSGRRTAILVRGEPGIGKSRLVHELRAEAGEDFQRLDLECAPGRGSSALHPVIAGLRRRWRIERATPGEQVERLTGALSAHPALASPETRGLLAGLLGVVLAPGEDPTARMSPQRRRAETLRVLTVLLRAEAARLPLLLVVEDAHWADPSTLELLGAVLDAPEDTPLMLVVTARPELTAPLDARADVEVVDLGPLGPDDVREIVRRTSGGAELAPEVVERVSAATEGIPLFAEELTRTVLESGSGPEAGPPVIPTTLYGCLMARLDRDRPTRTVAQLAATIGRRFELDLLLAVSQVDAEAARAALGQLVGAGLLTQGRGGEAGAYAFRHALMQEAARQSLLRGTRERYHGQIADALLERWPQRSQEQPELLAEHLEAAARPREAIGWWQQAGLAALQRSANAGASLRFERALGLVAGLADDEDRARTELELRVLAALPLTATQGWTAPAVTAHYHRAQELGERVGDAPQLLPTRVGLTAYLIVSGQLGAAREMGAESLALAQSVGSDEMMVEAEVDLGNACFYLGRHADALAHLERVDDRYDPVRDGGHAFMFGRDPAAIAHVHRALALWCAGRADAALQAAEAAVDVGRAVGHPFSQAWAGSALALLLLLRGEVDAGREAAEAVVAQSAIEGFPGWYAQGCVYRGWALAMQGDLGDATAQVEEGLGIWEASGARLMLPWLLAVRGDVLGRTGDVAEARATLARALAIARETGERWSEAELLRMDGMLAAQAGNRAEACDRVASALALARTRDEGALALRAAISLAELDADRGLAPLRELHDAVASGGDTADLQRARALLDEARRTCAR